MYIASDLNYRQFENAIVNHFYVIHSRMIDHYIDFLMIELTLRATTQSSFNFYSYR